MERPRKPTRDAPTGVPVFDLLGSVIVFLLWVGVSFGIGRFIRYLKRLWALPDWATEYILTPLIIFFVLIGIPCSAIWIANERAEKRSRLRDTAKDDTGDS